MESEYKKQANDFLAEHSITFSAEHIGPDCPNFCDDREKGKAMGEINKYPRKTHIHGHHYVATFTRRTKVSEADGKPVYTEIGRPFPSFTIDFWNSYADEEHNALGCQRYRNGDSFAKYGFKGGKDAKRVVEAYDVLACLTKYDPGTFENFCGEFGYDTDSRKAEQVYFAVQKEFAKVQSFFLEAEIEELQEIN